MTALIWPRDEGLHVNINLLSELLNKNIRKGYVQFIYDDITIRISQKYCIWIILKRNIRNNLNCLSNYLDIFRTIIKQLTGVTLKSFTFKFCNIQGHIDIPNQTLFSYCTLLQSLKKSKKISSYYTIDCQNFISCRINKNIRFQIRPGSIRFVVNSFLQLEKLKKFVETYFP